MPIATTLTRFKHYLRPFQRLEIPAWMAKGAVDRDGRRLVDLIRSKGGSVTARDLLQAARRQYPTAADADAALGRLGDAGLGAWEKVESKCPTRHFTLADAGKAVESSLLDTLKSLDREQVARLLTNLLARCQNDRPADSQPRRSHDASDGALAETPGHDPPDAAGRAVLSGPTLRLLPKAPGWPGAGVLDHATPKSAAAVTTGPATQSWRARRAIMAKGNRTISEWRADLLAGLFQLGKGNNDGDGQSRLPWIAVR